MWVKLAGSILVIAASTAIGFRLAAEFEERPRQIRHLQGMLTGLKAFINFSARPLPEALRQIASGRKGPVAEMFLRTGELLGRSGENTEQALAAARMGLAKQLALARPEAEVLEQLFAVLGKTNRREQEKCLDLAINQLQEIEQEAAAEREKHTKVCRYLGVCGGLAIVIVLI